MNILVLHALGNPALVPSLLREHVYFIRDYYPEHNYIFHDAALSIPEYIRHIDFDAILLDVTFLGFRWRDPLFFSLFLKSYAFVSESNAIKIAFPQDEYDCHKLLDDWMVDWRVDVVFSVVSTGWDVLYPRYSKIGEIRLGYTGYLDERLLRWSPKKHSLRKIDVGYRARKLPPNYGRLGLVKWTIGEDFAREAAEFKFNLDIKLGENYMLFGGSWLSFLDDSKFTLGANSGSSLLDPIGEVRSSVRAYMVSNPAASFKEVERNCFMGLDIFNFTAVSPRVIEAALVGSGQILVEGEYSGLVEPYEHYIPIKADASNILEVKALMEDVQFVEKMVGNCRETILGFSDLRSKNRAAAVLDIINEFKDRRSLDFSSVDITNILVKYQSEMSIRYRAHWFWQSLRGRGLVFLRNYPRVYEFFRYLKIKLYGFFLRVKC